MPDNGAGSVERGTRPLRAGLAIVGRWALQRAGLRWDGHPARRHLARIVESFQRGYSAALETPDLAAMAPRLDAVDPEHRGFAYEGASMALAMLDTILRTRHPRLQRFAEGAGAPHIYMVHVGAGWAAARLHRSLNATRRGLDPLLGWLAIDGYGFHEGFFHTERVVRKRAVARGADGYAGRAFDQGLGRSLWFVERTGVHAIAQTVATFRPERRADLWSGVALAAAYAGGTSIDGLRILQSHAAGYEGPVAQGAAFAAAARHLADNAAGHTEDACRILCGTSAAEAAARVRTALATLQEHPDRPAYEQWRQQVAASFVGRVGEPRAAVRAG